MRIANIEQGNMELVHTTYDWIQDLFFLNAEIL